MKKYIKVAQIQTVQNWNRDMRLQARYMEVYTLGNGSMVDEPRKRGFVVNKEHIEGGKKSRFFLSQEKALEYYYSDNF